MKVGIVSLKRKAFLIIFDDLKMILIFKLFLHVLKISVSCFLFWNEIFPKNSKQIKISFLSLMEFDVLRVINNLSKILLVQLSMKKCGKEFFCHINFKHWTSLWNVLQSAHILNARNKRVWIKPFFYFKGKELLQFI